MSHSHVQWVTGHVEKRPLPECAVEVLRRNDGRRSLRQILSSMLSQIPETTLGEQLCVLYQLDILNLLPPR